MRHLLSKNSPLIPLLLITFAFLTRLPLILPNLIPFTYDHGRDAIIIMHTVKTKTFHFIGPTTSIPGLFYGPYWTLLLVPSFILFAGHPIGLTLTLLCLNLVLIYLFYKHFGALAALIATTTPLWTSISTSAWNPFPTPLIILGILILLTKLPKASPSNFFFLGVLSGLLFSSGTASLLPLYICLSLTLSKKAHRPTLQQLGLLLLGLFITLSPTVLFEIKHHFPQTKAIISYIHSTSQSGDQTSGTINVLKGTTKILLESTLPNLHLGQTIHIATIGLCLSILLFGAFNATKQHQQPPLPTFSSLLIICSLLLFALTHFNYWYTLILPPVFVLLAAHFLSHTPHPLRLIYITLLVLTPLSNVIFHFHSNRQVLQTSRLMLPAKLQTIAFIRHQAAGEPFAVYHYLPPTYDYEYQYLYLWQAFHGQPLPTEFSYQPGEINYVPEKVSLLTHLHPAAKSPNKIFYVVEQPENEHFLKTWWQHQSYGEITAKTHITPTITVYQATPK